MFWLRVRQETGDKALRTRIPGMGEQSFPVREAEEEREAGE